MARKTLTITIDLEGDALAGDFGDQEAKDLLRDASIRLQNMFGRNGWTTGAEARLWDSNGNRVGGMTVTEA